MESGGVGHGGGGNQGGAPLPPSGVMGDGLQGVAAFIALLQRKEKERQEQEEQRRREQLIQSGLVGPGEGRRAKPNPTLEPSDSILLTQTHSALTGFSIVSTKTDGRCLTRSMVHGARNDLPPRASIPHGVDVLQGSDGATRNYLTRVRHDAVKLLVCIHGDATHPQHVRIKDIVGLCISVRTHPAQPS